MGKKSIALCFGQMKSRRSMSPRILLQRRLHRITNPFQLLCLILVIILVIFRPKGPPILRTTIILVLITARRIIVIKIIPLRVYMSKASTFAKSSSTFAKATAASAAEGTLHGTLLGAAAAIVRDETAPRSFVQLPITTGIFPRRVIEAEDAKALGGESDVMDARWSDGGMIWCDGGHCFTGYFYLFGLSDCAGSVRKEAVRAVYWCVLCLLYYRRPERWMMMGACPKDIFY
mmetsp:Transcript_46455/g.97623  ORF Transcript_46455/g.97623 Transcript_46455/m.97623 type:complete len:232 (+) Transcript_46455:1982-2677(+)